MEAPKPQLVEMPGIKPGQKSVKRLKARHLSPLTKRIICDLFAAYESFDDVAKEMNVPGLNRSVISEVLHSVQIRKAPASEVRPVAQIRRQA